MLLQSFQETYHEVLMCLQGASILHGNVLAAHPEQVLESLCENHNYPLVRLVFTQAALFERLQGAYGLEFVMLVCKFVTECPYEPPLKKSFRLTTLSNRLSVDWAQYEKRNDLVDVVSILALLPSARGYSIELGPNIKDLASTALRSCILTRVIGKSEDFESRVQVLRVGWPSDSNHTVYCGLLIQANLEPMRSVKVILVTEVIAPQDCEGSDSFVRQLQAIGISLVLCQKGLSAKCIKQLKVSFS